MQHRDEYRKDKKTIVIVPLCSRNAKMDCTGVCHIIHEIGISVQTQLIKQLFRSRNFLSTPSNLIKMGICLSVSNVSHRIEHKKYLKRIKPFLHQHHQYHHFNYHKFHNNHNFHNYRNFHNTQCIIVSYRDSSPHKQTAWQPGIKIFRLQ